jgi:hypothetical protein
MGAWGFGSFENDSALDWVNDLIDCDDTSAIESAIASATISPEDYLEIDEGCAAIAAGEVVAAFLQRPAAALPPDVSEWIRQHPRSVSPELTKQALSAIDRVAGENSEIRELCEESDGFDEWRAGIDDLRSRLGAS